MGSLDLVVRLLIRCDIYDTVYCTGGDNSRHHLPSSVVDSYASVLEFFASVKQAVENNYPGWLFPCTYGKHTYLQPAWSRIWSLALLSADIDNVRDSEVAVIRDGNLAYRQGRRILSFLSICWYADRGSPSVAFAEGFFGM